MGLLTTLYAEPKNLSLIKASLEQYHDSGAYAREIASIINEATYYLRFRIHQNQQLQQPQKLAIVLDIDDTSLSNYAILHQFNFGGTTSEINAALKAAHDPAIQPTLALFNFAKTNQVAVFFITARPQSLASFTEQNLKTAGFSGWQAIYFNADNNTASPATFKTAMRKKIIDQGYDIVLNIGDQYSDLKGNYADMDFKLPNPYYLTP